MTPPTRELRGFLHPHSLRFKALVVVVLLVISPLVWVWGTTFWDVATRVQMKRDLEATTANVARALRHGRLQSEVVARSNRVRIRVFTDAGELLVDADHEGLQRWHQRATDVFFGPAGRPDPSDWDAERPPPLERSEARLAQLHGRGTACEVSTRGDLLTCAEARRVETEGGPAWLHVQSSFARTTRSLYAERFQMLQLTLYVLLMAVPMTVWLGIRWVRPLESLRDQALERTTARVSTEPLSVDRKDEYGELADAFNTLLSAIEDRNRANETFAADLAHELKNPIAAVRTAAEALEPGRPLTEARAARLHRILSDSSQRMAHVIDRFLELARAEAGLADHEREPVDLVPLSDALLDAFRSDEQWADRSFERAGTTQLVVPGLQERLETVLRNLIGNAASFAGPGGTIRLTIDTEGSQACIQVHDTGPGIPADDLPRVFDRYFSKRQGGTGLGLALSKAIAEAHGGSLTASSEPGQGATFTLMLPR